jgi:enamine deaminase RidA (YjgF/YER057c/UK114 family)
MQRTMSERQNIGSGRPWEDAVGYSRAVRVGDHVFVSGTTASDATGSVVEIGNAYGQAMFCFHTIEAALKEAGATMGDVVRTRMFVTDITHFEAVGRAHAQFFGSVRPAATMVEVNRLVLPELLVEIEVDAVLTHTT